MPSPSMHEKRSSNPRNDCHPRRMIVIPEEVIVLPELWDAIPER